MKTLTEDNVNNVCDSPFRARQGPLNFRGKKKVEKKPKKNLPKISKMNDIIKLSVGGREFKTSRGTLMAGGRRAKDAEPKWKTCTSSIGEFRLFA